MLKDNLAKKIREKGGDLRCSALSRKTGIMHETIFHILKGNTKNPGVYTVAKLADVLECSVDELVDRYEFLKSFSQKNARHLKYDHKIFNEVWQYVSKYVENSKDRIYSFANIMHTINQIYEYSIDNKLDYMDNKFAEWFCKNQMHLLKK